METTTSADGTLLAFDRLGDGPAVVIIAGATCTRGVTAALAAALAAELTVINVDRRGRGDSGDASNPPPYSAEREVEDVAALIEAVGGSAAVYGHSSGAAVALRAAAAGIGVTRVIAHDAPYNLPGTEHRGRDWDAQLQSLLTEGRRGDAMAAFLTMIGMPAATVGHLRAAPHWPALEAVAPTLAYDSAAMDDRSGGPVPAALLSTVDVPAMVLAGGPAGGFMLTVAEALAAALPDATLTHLAGAGHDAGPDLVAPAVLPFLLA